MSDLHKDMGMYCPHCLFELTVVKKTGHYFCPHVNTCEYERHPKNEVFPLSEKERDHLSTLQILDVQDASLNLYISASIEMKGQELTRLELIKRASELEVWHG